VKKINLLPDFPLAIQVRRYLNFFNAVVVVRRILMSPPAKNRVAAKLYADRWDAVRGQDKTETQRISGARCHELGAVILNSCGTESARVELTRFACMKPHD
jgi:hypothetical protein